MAAPTHVAVVLIYLFNRWSLVCGGHNVYNPASNPLAPYSGGGGGRRQGGFGYVNEWPAGFFVGGSSIHELNGLYFLKRDDDASPRLPHRMSQTYVNRDTQWLMSFAGVEQDGIESVGGKATEWQFTDPTKRTRFASEGGSYLPGAGLVWKHIYRPHLPGTLQAGDEVTTRVTLQDFWEQGDAATVTAVSADQAEGSPYTIKLARTGKVILTQAWRVFKPLSEAEDQKVEELGGYIYSGDEAELPWQVVGIMGNERMEELWQQKKQHDASVRRAMMGMGASLPRLPPGASVSTDGGDELPLTIADDACREGNYQTGIDLYDKGLSGVVSVRRQSYLLSQKASCLRKMGKPKDAMQATDRALQLVPRHKHAIFQKALAQLDSANPFGALTAFEMLLQVDRDYPNLDSWLTHAHARCRYHGRGPIADGFSLGDRVKTHSRYPDLWEAGAQGTVSGLGTSDAPIAVRFDLGERVIRLQSDHILFVDGQQKAIPGAPGDSQAGLFGWMYGSKNDDQHQSEEEKEPTEHDEVQMIANSKDHYNALGLAADFSPEELRRAYRQKSRKAHPDRNGGSSGAFQKVGAAYEVLSDPLQRRAYDSGEIEYYGDGLTLKEEVVQRYFPERQGFNAFGDPLEKRKEHEKRKRQEKEREKAQQHDAEWRAKHQNDEL